jgi:hypothetical protein
MDTETDTRVGLDGVQLHVTAEVGPRMPVVRVVRSIENITVLLRTIMGVGVLANVLNELHDNILDETFGTKLVVSVGTPLQISADSLVPVLVSYHLEHVVDQERLAASVHGVGYTGSAALRTVLADELLDYPPSVIDTLAENLDADWRLVALTYRNPLDFLIDVAGVTAAAYVATAAWVLTSWQNFLKARADIRAVNASTEKTRVETEIEKAKLKAELANAKAAKVALDKQRVELEAAKLSLEAGRAESKKPKDKQLDAVALGELRAIAQSEADASVDVAQVFAKAAIEGNLRTSVSEDSKTVLRLGRVS